MSKLRRFVGPTKTAPVMTVSAIAEGVKKSIDPIQVSYTKVGEHRGQRRLWLEGGRLEAAGFEAGQRYHVVFDVDTRTIALELSSDGDRQVSGRRRVGQDKATPILDLAGADVTDIVGEAGSVRALIGKGRIVFSLHPRDVAKAEREQRLREHVREGYVTEGTLCAGGGIATLGIARGIEEAGLLSRVEWIVDRERKYLEVADQNNPVVGPETKIYEASLEELEPALVCRVDVLQVSLPCTGHSKSGKAKRGLAQAEDHPTDALGVFGALRIMDAVQPTVVVSENVTEASTSATYALMRAYLKDAGYQVFEKVMDETDAGTVERRKRWWFVAISDGVAAGFDLTNLPARLREYRTLGDLLEHVPADDPQWRRHDYLDDKQERDAEAGKGFKRQLVTAESESVGTVGRGYSKRRSTEPFFQREDGMERLLTPVEHARIKGIPEVMVDGVTATTAHEVLGQSILLPHATAIGKAVGDHLRELADEDEDRPTFGL
ncbi:MAG: DNA cytosine methyltransferase [Burkholderiaceae bacterium]|nr:MAG: DNA cytosine methyltransferase [Burkholderiaceae bacterium]